VEVGFAISHDMTPSDTAVMTIEKCTKKRGHLKARVFDFATVTGGFGGCINRQEDGRIHHQTIMHP
jgi:hypothetical protein